MSAYTLDGGAPGEICWETFSGDAAEVIIDGITTHTMEARAKGMVNAAYLAGKLLAALPRERCAPETTEGREGFIHPISVEGRTERAIVKFILRDFELKGLAEKGKILQRPLPRVTSHRAAGARSLQNPQTISQHGLLVAQGHAPG